MKTVAITMGEPGGIGPEVIVKALSRAEIRGCCNPVVIGDVTIMREAVKLSDLPLRIKTVSGIARSQPAKGTIEVLDIRSRLPARRGVPSGSSGKAFYKYIEKAIELASQNEVQAIVTAPISKESLKMAGYGWPGHTEMLAELTSTEHFAMMFVSEKLKVILCTIHMPLKDVPERITRASVYKTITLAKKGMEMLGIKTPHIAVSGLNPHAGESGIMGNEESGAIIPAVKKAQKEGMNVTGPLPPDVVFYKAYNNEFDIIVCMYHDQGLIPFKMLAFDTGVNVTVGLPVIRTSPDHGTGFDIAWKNMANPSSMIEAIKLAARMKLKL